MSRIIINDKEMYRYFDYLFYGHGEDEKGIYKHRLKKEWKKKSLIAPYGMTNCNVNEMMGSKSLLYGERDARAQLCVLDGMQKFLHEYVGIEGLEKLLLNNYGTIENEIFFEHDAKGNPVHIREHAKHQMKNAFLGSVLLLEYGYLEDIVKKIMAAESSTANYLVYQAITAEFGNAKISNISQNTVRGILEPEYRQNVIDKLQEWTYKIFMISSMLHDIGYPLEYYLRTAKTLTEFPPYLNILSPVVKADFAQIKATLLESQLFQQTDHIKIRQKYDMNNHGVLSAISLLMHFYHNGKIYTLKPEERCLIEMSAIAIYHHTDKFESEFRMSYQKDPISYMVRICDDLQEWERFKIIMNDKHNYLQCGRCGSLILSNHREYKCSCCGQMYIKVTQINNRKMNYICLCDELFIEKKLKENQVVIIVHFNLLKQLEILMDDYTAIIRRGKDLEKVKNMLEMQSMNPKLKVAYFVSNNPYYLIEQMLQESDKNFEDIQQWINNIEEEKKRENMKKFMEDYLQHGKEALYGSQLEENSLKYEKKVKAYIQKYYGEIYSLFQYLNGSVL
ncbi:MAG: hypothetical protein HFJ06_15765 [Lachnospiraceae bacterium]|jgi:hypothetical protein|nr:hypothetical protein [Lachnospiraceae bacterium]MCI9659308.1 hypothetical protein [Lachnospiraceae bacterium]